MTHPIADTAIQRSDLLMQLASHWLFTHTVGLLILSLISASFLVYYYSRKDVHIGYRCITFIGWSLGMCVIAVLPLDIVLSIQNSLPHNSVPSNPDLSQVIPSSGSSHRNSDHRRLLLGGDAPSILARKLELSFFDEEPQQLHEDPPLLQGVDFLAFGEPGVPIELGVERKTAGPSGVSSLNGKIEGVEGHGAPVHSSKAEPTESRGEKLLPNAERSGSYGEYAELKQRWKRLLLHSWGVVYWVTFALTVVLYPIILEFDLGGEFNFWPKLVASVYRYVRYYFYLLCGGIGVLIVWLAYYRSMSFAAISGLIIAASNTWGLIQIMFLLSYGLVALPRSLYNKLHPERLLLQKYAEASKLYRERQEQAYNLAAEYEKLQQGGIFADAVIATEERGKDDSPFFLSIYVKMKGIFMRAFPLRGTESQETDDVWVSSPGYEDERPWLRRDTPSDLQKSTYDLDPKSISHSKDTLAKAHGVRTILNAFPSEVVRPLERRRRFQTKKVDEFAFSLSELYSTHKNVKKILREYQRLQSRWTLLCQQCESLEQICISDETAMLTELKFASRETIATDSIPRDFDYTDFEQAHARGSGGGIEGAGFFGGGNPEEQTFLGRLLHNRCFGRIHFGRTNWWAFPCLGDRSAGQFRRLSKVAGQKKGKGMFTSILFVLVSLLCGFTILLEASASSSRFSLGAAFTRSMSKLLNPSIDDKKSEGEKSLLLFHSESAPNKVELSKDLGKSPTEAKPVAPHDEDFENASKQVSWLEYIRLWAVEGGYTVALFFIMLLTFWGVFHVKLHKYYGIYGPQMTHTQSLLHSGGFIAPLAAPLSYHILQMFHIYNSSFEEFYGQMRIVPLFGIGINRLFPWILILMFFANTAGIVHRIMDFLHLSSLDMHEDFEEDAPTKLSFNSPSVVEGKRLTRPNKQQPYDRDINIPDSNYKNHVGPHAYRSTYLAPSNKSVVELQAERPNKTWSTPLDWKSLRPSSSLPFE